MRSTDENHTLSKYTLGTRSYNFDTHSIVREDNGEKIPGGSVSMSLFLR